MSMSLRVTRLMDNGVLLAISRGPFAVSMNWLATNCALFITNSMNSVFLSEDCFLVSSVNIDILDLIVLSKFNISAWFIESMDMTVTVAVTDTVTMTVAVFSVVRSMIIIAVAVTVSILLVVHVMLLGLLAIAVRLVMTVRTVIKTIAVLVKSTID